MIGLRCLVQAHSTEKQTHFEYGGELPRQTNECHHSSSNEQRNAKVILQAYSKLHIDTP